MSATREPEPRPAVLPELEQLLVRAARRRATRRVPRRRWVLAVAIGALVLAAAAAAATRVFDVASGTTPHGTFTVARRPVSAPGVGGPRQGAVCLQLTYGGPGGGSSYGCGRAPSPAHPFGLLIADPLAEGLHEEVVYGLVGADIARIAVLGDGGRHTFASTTSKEGLPGRFFAVVVPHRGRVEVVGYGADGKARARIGSLATPSHPPHSKAEAIAQGDPAGFAPTLEPPPMTFEGRRISSAEVTRLGLSCAIRRNVARCFRTGEGPAAAGGRLREAEAGR